jgi:hypothetical protein
VPGIGQEIAAAAALNALAHHLLEQAAHRIESREGRSMRLCADRRRA